MMEWISVNDKLPELPEGHRKLVIVSVYRKHSNKSYVFTAEYLNKVWVELDGDYEDGDEEYYLTGWFTVENDVTGNYDKVFEYVAGPDTGDIVTHWMPLPLPPGSVPTTS